jgi:hypothetical protein
MKIVQRLYASLALVLSVAVVLRLGAWLIAPLLPGLGVLFFLSLVLVVMLGGRPGKY